MASLTGQQIDLTYGGLLKTDDNGAIGATLKTLTDGLGNAAPMQLSTSAVNFTGTVTGDNNTTYDLGVIQDASNAEIQLTGSDLTTDPVTLIAGSNITLTVSGTDVTIDAAGGGGGSAGMVADSGAFSVKNADFLNQSGFPAVASGNDALALMSNARAQGNNSVSLGTSSRASANFGVAISAGAFADGTGSVAIGYNSSTNGSIGNSTAIGDSAGAEGYQSNAIGYLSDADAQQATAIGSRASMLNTASQGLVMGYNCNLANSNPGGVLLGANSSTPFLQNAQDSVNIGSSLQLSGNIYNSLTMGLVAKNSGSNDAATIGRAAGNENSAYSTAIGAESYNYNSERSVSIGAEAKVGDAATTTGAIYGTAIGFGAQCISDSAASIGRESLVPAGFTGAVALGQNVTALWAQATTVNQLAVANYANLNFADDAAAATGGVPLGGIYHNAGALRIRIV